MATTDAITLHTSVGDVPGVRARDAKALRRLGLTNVGRLIAHLPMRHERQAAEDTIDRLPAGQIITARGVLGETRVVPFGRKPRFQAVLEDHTGRLLLTFFNQAYLRHKLHPGMRLRVQGKAKRVDAYLQLINPRWEVMSDEGDEPSAQEERLRPVYPASEEIDSRRIEAAIEAVLDDALERIEDHLPEDHRRERNLPTLSDAYRMIHRPETEEEVKAARRRLAYDELLLLQLAVQMRRSSLRAEGEAVALELTDDIDARIRARLPFTLTKGQDAAVRRIAEDLAKTTPANRLLQGDVGSGKTAVALCAMLLAIAHGRQAALLAPTELLAEQHAMSIGQILEGSKVRVELLTGSLTAEERSAALARIGAGDTDIVIGTHALLSEGVRFKSLAVAVIDEQHRFGVAQRARLGADAAGGVIPHRLVMTATPIPRTLALSVFGDLDVTTIKGMPPGRSPVATRLVSPQMEDQVYGFVRERVDAGEQAYVVVPAIDGGSSSTGLRDLRTLTKRLEEGPLAGKRVAALHGRLKRETRERVMARFRAGEIDALVATTVIEVGVDVPGATVMVVEHAERFGLAQLHQLRGRVGRGERKSVCVLVGQPTTPEGEARLRAMAETTDGFALAEKDLEIRGPGELVGARQAGLSPMRVADLVKDLELLGLARRDAQAWVERSPDLASEPVLRRRVLKAHGEALGLADVA